jgi:hypothetical protein
MSEVVQFPAAPRQDDEQVWLGDCQFGGSGRLLNTVANALIAFES